MDTLREVAQIAGYATGILSFLCIIIRPIRNKILGFSDIRDGVRCMLRSEMLKIYYKNRESKSIRQYDLENFIHLYTAYKALDGNSFIDKIKAEIEQWEVIS